MRFLVLLLLVVAAPPIYSATPSDGLVAPPFGATLPVILGKTLKSEHLVAGQPVIARLSQRVPVGAGVYLPASVKIAGRIVRSDPSSLSILFTQLRWKGQTLPIHVKLLAAASFEKVFDSGVPVDGIDRGTSNPADWTTRQIGGDQVDRSAGSGKVYDQYSQPVGYADLNGVYARSPAGGVPRALGPFSATAAGLHGLPGFSIVSVGGAGAPLTLRASHSKWKIVAGGAFLLQLID